MPQIVAYWHMSDRVGPTNLTLDKLNVGSDFGNLLQGPWIGVCPFFVFYVSKKVTLKKCLEFL